MLRARREFGGVEQYKEQCRDERRWHLLAQLWQDVSFGFRMTRKTAAVTAAALLTLALGIGATTAILTLMDAVLWRQLAVPHPEELTEVLWQSKDRTEGLYRNSNGNMHLDGATHVADFFSQPAFQALRAGIQGVEVAGHLNPEDVSTSYAGATAVAQLRPVSGNFFPLLQVRPAAGRLLSPADDRAGAALAVVISHSYWTANLNGDPRVIGPLLRINNRSYTITGVLPERFLGISTGDSTDLYAAMGQSPSMLDEESWLRRATADPRSWYVQLLARRAPGASLASLRPAMDAIFRSTWGGQPTKEAGAPAIRSQPAGIGSLRREVGNPPRILLTACANITTLMLARADSRRREVALRISLGCSRARLVRQFFTESVLLALCGGVLSIGVAYATARFAATLMPGHPRLSLDTDLRVVLAAVAIDVRPPARAVRLPRRAPARLLSAVGTASPPGAGPGGGRSGARAAHDGWRLLRR